MPPVRIVGPEEGVSLRGGTHLLKAGVEDTGGALTVWTSRTQFGKGPPVHFHDSEDELFYVLGGRYEMVCGARRVVADAGCLMFMPRFTPHAFRSVSETAPGRLLHAVVPGGFERYLASIGDSDAETAEGRELRRIAGERFGLHFPADPSAPVSGAERQPPPRILPAPPKSAPAGARTICRLAATDTAGRIALDELLVSSGADWDLEPAATQRVAHLCEGELTFERAEEECGLGEGATLIVPPGEGCRGSNRGPGSARLALISAPA